MAYYITYIRLRLDESYGCMVGSYVPEVTGSVPVKGHDEMQEMQHPENAIFYQVEEMKR